MDGHAASDDFKDLHELERVSLRNLEELANESSVSPHEFTRLWGDYRAEFRRKILALRARATRRRPHNPAPDTKEQTNPFSLAPVSKEDWAARLERLRSRPQPPLL